MWKPKIPKKRNRRKIKTQLDHPTQAPEPENRCYTHKKSSPTESATTTARERTFRRVPFWGREASYFWCHWKFIGREKVFESYSLDFLRCLKFCLSPFLITSESLNMILSHFALVYIVKPHLVYSISDFYNVYLWKHLNFPCLKTIVNHSLKAHCSYKVAIMFGLWLSIRVCIFPVWQSRFILVQNLALNHTEDSI